MNQSGLQPSVHLLFLSFWYISASLCILFQDSLHAVAIGGSKMIFLVFVTSKDKGLCLTNSRQKMLLKELTDTTWVIGPFLDQSLCHGT